MAQLVASVSGVVLGGVAEVVGSNLARGKIFTASIGSVDSLYPSVQHLYIYEHGQDMPYSSSDEYDLSWPCSLFFDQTLNHKEEKYWIVFESTWRC